MKVIHEKAIEVYNDLKLDIDEQQDVIEYLKEQCDIDNEVKFRKSQLLETP